MKKKTICSLLAICLTTAIYSIPAKRVIYTVKQADRTTLDIRNNGDEWCNYLSTIDGHPIIQSKEGVYYYIQCSENGDIEPSSQQAHNPNMRTEDEQLFLQKNPAEDIKNAFEEARATTFGLLGSTRMGEMPQTLGSPNIPILLIAFKDQTFKEEFPLEGYTHRLCRSASREDIENRNGSAYQYFHDQSDGQFTPNFVIIGPITLENSYTYYGENDTNGLDLRAGEMISEAILKAESAGLVDDWSIFDNNHDGVVDVTYALYAGEGANVSTDANLIWPHQSTLSSKGVTSPELDNVQFNAYGCNNELMFGEIDGFGTFCHEFSHCLGLPDFYPTNSGTDVFGMDYWSLMDFGSYKCDGYIPVGYTAYEKELLGWKSLQVLDQPTSVTTLKTTADGGDGYKVINPKSVNEYYILETVDNSGWNKGNYAQGVLITHVNYNATTWKNNTVNNNARIPGVSIIPADNDMTILVRGSNEDEYENSLKGDLYPSPNGNNSLTNNSIPAAEVYIGLDGYMNQPITNITYDATSGTASFDFMGGNAQAISSPRKESEQSISVHYLNGVEAIQPLTPGVYLQKDKNGKVKKLFIH